MAFNEDAQLASSWPGTAGKFVGSPAEAVERARSSA
jgi:hypothetical protein